MLGVNVDELIADVIAGMQAVAGDLGLAAHRLRLELIENRQVAALAPSELRPAATPVARPFDSALAHDTLYPQGARCGYVRPLRSSLLATCEPAAFKGNLN